MNTKTVIENTSDVNTTYTLCNWPRTQRQAMALLLSYENKRKYVYVDKVMIGVTTISVTFKRFMDIIKPMDIDTIIRNGDHATLRKALYFGTERKRGAKQQMLHILDGVDELAISLFRNTNRVDPKTCLLSQKELNDKGQMFVNQQAESQSNKEFEEAAVQKVPADTGCVSEIYYCVFLSDQGHVVVNSTVDDLSSIGRNRIVKGAYRSLAWGEYRKWKITKANKAKVAEYLKKVNVS